MSALEIDPDGHYLDALLGVAFTDAQRRVATHGLTPQLVVAGAGSGKTMVMAARVVHAVAHRGLQPGQILGLTFTTKAAGELAERVRASLDKLAAARAGSPATDSRPPVAEDGSEDAPDDVPTIATYNSFAAGLVRDHALRIGREPVSQLVTEASAWQLAMSVVRAAPGPFLALGLTPPTIAAYLLALADELSGHLVEPAAARAENDRIDGWIHAEVGTERPGWIAKLAESTGRRAELLELVERYQERKRELEVLDYGDQVALAATIVERAPQVATLLRDRFRLVVLDEYQDTGIAQRRLLSALFASHAVTAVGDPHQAIYGWRGASLGNLRRFGEHYGVPGIKAQPLVTSFRNGGRILAGANAVSAPLREAEAAATLDVEILTAAPGREDDGRIDVARFPTALDEAAWIGDEVRRELDTGRAPGEIAILIRRRADIQRLHAALLDRDVPVEVVGLGGLLELPEVVEVMSVLRVLVDPADNGAAVRLLTGPRWRIGVRDLAALGDRARSLARRPRGTSLRDAAEKTDPVEQGAILDAVGWPGDSSAYSPEALERFRLLTAELDGLRHLVGQPLVDVVTEVITRTGLDVEVEAATGQRATAAAVTLGAFLDQAARFVGYAGQTDLPSFLGYLEAAADEENGLDPGVVSTAETVKIMTIHKAKGLEWQVVIVPALVDTTFPSNRGRDFWLRNGFCVPNALRGDVEDYAVLTSAARAEVEAVTKAFTSASEPEERRLAYVAVTRARDRLIATAYCWSQTRKKPLDPSPYLEALRTVPFAETVSWCDDPAETGNPLLGAVTRVPWPVPPDESRLAGRREAAALVRTSLAAGVRAGSGPGTSVSPQARSWANDVRLVLDELRRAAEQVRDVPLPHRLSATQLVRLAADPDGLAASLARPMPARPAAQARRGSRFHLWVEQHYGAPLLLDDEELPGSGDDDLSDTELAGFQAAFRAGGWADRQPVPGGVEAPFELVIDGRLLRGRIDAVFADPDGRFDVVDWKTGVPPADTRAAALQLAVYRCAWAELSGVPEDQVRAAFVYLRTGDVVRPQPLPGRAELAALLRDDEPTSLF